MKIKMIRKFVAYSLKERIEARKSIVSKSPQFNPITSAVEDVLNIFKKSFQTAYDREPNKEELDNLMKEIKRYLKN